MSDQARTWISIAGNALIEFVSITSNAVAVMMAAVAGAIAGYMINNPNSSIPNRQFIALLFVVALLVVIYERLGNVNDTDIETALSAKSEEWKEEVEDDRQRLKSIEQTVNKIEGELDEITVEQKKHSDEMRQLLDESECEETDEYDENDIVNDEKSTEHQRLTDSTSRNSEK